MKAALLAVIAMATGAGAAVAQAPVVPGGQFLVSNRVGRLLVVDHTGRVERKLPFTRRDCCPGQVELSADRRHAFVSEITDRRVALIEVDLDTGQVVRIAAGGSPTVSPNGRKLAYFGLRYRNGILYRTGVVVRDLVSGRARTIRFTERTSWSTPPDVLINWSPDSRVVAVADFDTSHRHVVRLVDVQRANAIEAQPFVPDLTAPVFLDGRTLVGLANCCIGKQQMVAYDLYSGKTTPFATLPEPPESLRPAGHGALMTTTPGGYLLRFSKGHVTRLGTGSYFSVSG